MADHDSVSNDIVEFQKHIEDLKNDLVVLEDEVRGGLTEDSAAVLGRLVNQHRRSISQVDRASNQLANRIRQLDELVRTAALITSTLDLDEVLEDVMDTIVTLTGAERVYLMLYDDAKKLQTRAARNWDQETIDEAAIGISRTVVESAITKQEPVITTNAQADERFAATESITIQKLRSIICVPLMLGGKTVGVLYADNRFKRGAFTENMAPVLRAFGTQAAIAIINAQSFSHMRDNLEQAQRVIAELNIEIDHERVDEKVREITQTGYFQELAQAARDMRKRQKRSKPE